MNVPIISLEVQGMKHTIKTALMREAALMDTAIQKAVEDFCTEENINAIVRSAAERQLEEAVRSEVKDFFGWSGNGRKAVREAVTEFLNRRYPVEEQQP